MEKEVLKFIDKQVSNGKKAALIMLTDTSGSTPGKAGSIMAVDEDNKRCGTVGGGNLENQIIISALKAIEDGSDTKFSHNLTETGDLGMVCGGSASGYIKLFRPKHKLVIVGAGHIGKALFEVASTLDFDIIVMDDRKEYANSQNYPGAYEIIVDDYEKSLEELKTDKSTHIVIVTRGHKHDKIALKKLLNKKSGYIGMIGSQRKVKTTLDELSKDERFKDSLYKLYAPIGLDIGSNLPKEIALSIMCEIVLVKNNKKPALMRDLYKEKMNLAK